MPRQPNLRRVNLNECCHKQIDYIRWVTRGSKWIQLGLMPAVFLSLFVSPSARGGGISTFIYISQADWVGLARVTHMIPVYERRKCTDAAHLHALDHSGSKLDDFWIAIGDAF